MISNNTFFFKEYSRFPIGSSRVGRNEVEDAFLTLIPEDPSGYVPQIKFIANHGVEVLFSNITFYGEGRVKRSPATFYGKTKQIKCSFRLAPPFSDKHKIDLIPDFRIDTVFVEFDDNLLVFEYNDEKITKPGIMNHVKEWVRNSIDGHFHLPRMAFASLHQMVAEYIESKLNLANFKGKINLLKIHFYEDYIDIGFRFEFTKYEDSEFIHKTGIFKDSHESNQEGVELILDENIINTFFYAFYHLDDEFSVRALIKPLKDYQKFLKVKFH